MGEHTLVRGALGYYQVTKGVRTRLTNFIVKVECYARDAAGKMMVIGQLRLADCPDGEHRVELPVDELRAGGMQVSHAIWERVLDRAPDARPYARAPKDMDLLFVVRAFDAAPYRERARKLGAAGGVVSLPWLGLSEDKVEMYGMEPALPASAWRHYAAIRSTDGGLEAARAVARTFNRGASALLALVAHAAHQAAARTDPDAPVRHLIVPCNNDGTWDALFAKLRLVLSGSDVPLILPSNHLEMRNTLSKYGARSSLPMVAAYRGSTDLSRQLDLLEFSTMLLVDRSMALRMDRHPLCVFAAPAAKAFGDHAVDVDDETVAELRKAFPAMVRALINDARLSSASPAEACLEAVGAEPAIKPPMSNRATEDADPGETLRAYLHFLVREGFKIGSGVSCVSHHPDPLVVASRMKDRLHVPVAIFTEALASKGIQLDAELLRPLRGKVTNKLTWSIPDDKPVEASKTA